MRVPLLSGAYSTRSIIASAQRCCNLYVEKNAPDSVAPTTHYPTPGLTKLGTPPQAATVRGLYTATNNQLFAAIGTGIYYVASDWTLTFLGSIASGTTQVKMGDNRTTMVIVDGTSAGYTVNLATHAFASLSDPAFYGSNFVEYLDTYLLFNKPGTNIFYSSDSNAVTFDALWFGAKSGYADTLAGIAVQQRQIWLIGQRTSEIWFDAGGADFPFQILPGPFSEHGAIAPYSIAKQGGSVFWLSQDQAGTAIVVQTVDYKVNEISTKPLEYEISTYSTISDAIGFCYEQQGHPFYWLKFPTAGKDWVYDLSTGQWHERFWLNGSTEESHRANCAAFAYGVNVVGDRANGQLYSLDPTNYTDYGGSIKRIRGFPHMMDDGNRVFYTSFIADMQAVNDPDAEISLRWSDDRGQTYGTPVTQSLGASADYLTQPQWNRLGMARDRVFEVSWTAAVNTALNGAFVETQPSGS